MPTKVFLNDVTMFDVKNMKITDQIVFSDVDLPKRMHHAGFKINASIFSVGGLCDGGRVLDEFYEIDINRRKSAPALVGTGRKLLGPIHSTVITPVFYPQKMPKERDLDLRTLCADIDWGEAEVFIKYEGFYLFGGKHADGSTLDTLLVIQVEQDDFSGRARFSIVKPEVQGKRPDPRFMHSFDYIPEMSAIAIYGGRNDTNFKVPIKYDLWLLKLHNLEFLKVQVGGEHTPLPRCNFASFVRGKELVVLGGQTEGFKPCRNLEIFQLDQAKVDKGNPILKHLQSHVKKRFKATQVEQLATEKNRMASQKRPHQINLFVDTSELQRLQHAKQQH